MVVILTTAVSLGTPVQIRSHQLSTGSKEEGKLSFVKAVVPGKIVRNVLKTSVEGNR